ncbi:MAG: YbhB/YbcL family Raf kinase inhibitor-like protein [Candidatus Dependentiae bacterium]|nr:YbhB/YbcL family Raf kinase inhibitor-like protein [Candidatus Dependentiae bacterium]
MKWYYGFLLVYFCLNQSLVGGTMKLTSADFKHSEQIPTRFTCEGENISPNLFWTGAPSKMETFVVIVEDPDAPSAKNPNKDAWVHWVAFNIPHTVHRLDVGAAIHALGGKEGINDSKNKKYDGPCPPAGSGPHRYFFRLYALNVTLSLHAGATKQEVVDAMKHHIIAQGELIGTYEIK